jgi:hypothetical protein
LVRERGTGGQRRGVLLDLTQIHEATSIPTNCNSRKDQCYPRANNNSRLIRILPKNEDRARASPSM